MKSRIQYTQPSISELEVQYVTDAVRHGWGARCYEYIERFDNRARVAGATDLILSAHADAIKRLSQ
mgnify:CR=1 FL=1